MFLIREVFHAKPGKSKALVEIFNKVAPILKSHGLIKGTRVLTDASSTFWTVIFENEVEDINNYLNMSKTVSSNPEFGEAMRGYTDLIKDGHREIFRIE